MNCPKCGQINQQGSSFCVHCGQPLNTVASKPAPPAVSSTSPMPSSQNSPPLVYGGFWKRLLAFWLIDGLVESLVGYLLILLFFKPPKITTATLNPNAFPFEIFAPLIIIFVFFVVFFYGYLVVTTALFGGTVGKLALGLRVIDEKTGQKIGWRKSFLRHVPGYVISIVVFYLGCLWVAFDAKKQGWHDKIAGTVVIDTKKRWSGWAIFGLIAGLTILAEIMFTLVLNKFTSAMGSSFTNYFNTKSNYPLPNQPKTNQTPKDLEQILQDKEFQKTVQELEKSGQLVSTVTAKDDLSEILKTAKDFNSNSHLFKVVGSHTMANDPVVDSVVKTQGSFPREEWTYWFRDQSKSEKDIFFVRFNKNSGFYMASDNVYLYGDVRGQDQGDITSLWQINSDKAFSLAWDQAAKTRDQYFETRTIKADLAYDYTTNTKDLVFMWVITYSYKYTTDGSPSDLKVYIDPQTGELINVNLKDLSKLR